MIYALSCLNHHASVINCCSTHTYFIQSTAQFSLNVWFCTFVSDGQYTSVYNIFGLLCQSAMHFLIWRYFQPNELVSSKLLDITVIIFFSIHILVNA